MGTFEIVEKRARPFSSRLVPVGAPIGRSGAFSKLESEWLQKHTSVSEEDFLREPHRNRFTILLGRTGHVAYHLGQAILAKPRK